MNATNLSRRGFLGGAVVLGSSSLVFPRLRRSLLAQEARTGAGSNWARNLKYSAARFHQPTTVEELRRIMRSARRVKGLGSRHSFSAIADTEFDLVSMMHFNRLVSIDAERRTVTVEGGMKYGELAVPLHRAGFALHNLASLPHISVAGAIATATHGSGNANGNLASIVSGLEFVTPDGELLKLERADGDAFLGAVVHLGAIGFLTRVTLDVVPSFDVQQYVYTGIEHEALAENFESIFGAAYSVSVFTNYDDPTFNAVWLKRKVASGTYTPPSKLYGARLAEKDLHPIVTLDATPCTSQRGVVGPWFERLPHFKMGFRPSTGAELQSEYFVPRRHSAGALRALRTMRDEFRDVLQISEVRTIKADALWMSTAYGEDRTAFHFTWVKDWPKVERVLPKIERALSPFGVRPHWGKLNTMPAKTLRARCPKLSAFRQLVAEHDPTGKCQNDYLRSKLFGDI